MKEFLCKFIGDSAHPVTLRRDDEAHTFIVTYGAQVFVESNTELALDQYLSCLSHAMQVDHLLPRSQILGRHEVPE